MSANYDFYQNPKLPGSKKKHDTMLGLFRVAQ